MRKSIIGIVLKTSRNQNEKTFIKNDMKQAIFDNGGIAIGIIPSTTARNHALNNWKNNLTKEDKNNIIAQLNMCNGIIIQGGNYSCIYECFIAKYCYDNDIPILGICAGKNVLVRAVGGKIKKLSNDSHNSSSKYVHSIKIFKSTILHKIINKTCLLVNSRHRYKTSCPAVLKISAVSPDNIIEAVEACNKRFYVALQFHPESLYTENKDMNKIFKSFIKICKKDQLDC